MLRASLRPKVLAIGLLCVVGCQIDNLTGPTSVGIGGTATYSMRFRTSGTVANALSVTPVLAMNVPIGWTVTSSSYTGTANGAPVSGSGTVVGSNPTACYFIPGINPGYQRIYVSAAAIPNPVSTDSATVSVTFLVQGAPGDYTLDFWGGANVILAPSAQTSDCPGPPTTIAVSVTDSAGLFFTLPPCRVLDTRNQTGPLGAPSLQPGATRTFDMAASECGIPADAVAISASIAVTNVAAPGELVVFRSDILPPIPSAISFQAGRTRANNAIISVANSGTTISVVNNSAAPVDFILDVNGFFR